MSAACEPSIRSSSAQTIQSHDPEQHCAFSEKDSRLTPDGSETWARAKHAGTMLLQTENWVGAAKQYYQAYVVAFSVQGQLQAYLDGLHRRSGSPLLALAGQNDILRRIWEQAVISCPRFLARARPRPCANFAVEFSVNSVDETGCEQAAADGPAARLLLPNLNAAICAANEAAAWIKVGSEYSDRALGAALRAVACCPEYPKGYHRALQAARSCGDQTSLKLANILTRRCSSITKCVGLHPSVAHGLFAAGEISLPMMQARLAWREQRTLEHVRPRAVLSDSRFGAQWTIARNG